MKMRKHRRWQAGMSSLRLPNWRALQRLYQSTKELRNYVIVGNRKMKWRAKRFAIIVRREKARGCADIHDLKLAKRLLRGSGVRV